MQNCTKGTFERPFMNISKGLLSDLIGWWDDCKGKQGKMGCNRERLPSYPVIPSSAQSRCHPIHLTPSGSPCRKDRSQRLTTPGRALAGEGSRALVNVLDLLTYPKTASCKSICNWLHTPDLYLTMMYMPAAVCVEESHPWHKQSPPPFIFNLISRDNASTDRLKLIILIQHVLSWSRKRL